MNLSALWQFLYDSSTKVNTLTCWVFNSLDQSKETFLYGCLQNYSIGQDRGFH